MRKGLIFIVSAPSGAGKTSLCKKVVDSVPDLRYSISYTTRPHRGGERDGVDYYFVSDGEFQKMAAEGKFVEWALVHGNSYGTSEETLRKCEDEGNDVILDIDVQGAMQIKDRLKRGVYIFILPPSPEELRKRLVNRGTDNGEAIRERLENAKGETAQIENYDYVIINENLDDAAKRLESIIIAERCRSAAMTIHIKDSWRF